jgi:ATP-grasp domain
MRVLLTDGSGLTARQTAGLLSIAGHHVEVLSPDPWCLCRFTRHVRAVRRVPAYGKDPIGWLDAAIEEYVAGGFDVLLPTQEQVAVLAARPRQLAAAGVRTAVPSFDSVAAVQDKVCAARTLSRLDIPQPLSSIGIGEWSDYPAFVKQPIGTASGGVRRISGPDGLRREGDAPVVLVQAAADGQLAMCQAVFDDGALVAFHANLRVIEGANGGASHKQGVSLPAVRESLRRLGQGLSWHGALSADVIITAAGPLVIDINPRLVEPVNAARDGVDLVGAMLAVATGEHPAPLDAHDDVRSKAKTHQLVLALLGAASRGSGRRELALELYLALRHRGPYAGSHEELTPLGGDPLSLLAVLRVALAVLVRPTAWQAVASGSVANYAMSSAGWEQIRAEVRREPVTAAALPPLHPRPRR